MAKISKKWQETSHKMKCITFAPVKYAFMCSINVKHDPIRGHWAASMLSDHMLLLPKAHSSNNTCDRSRQSRFVTASCFSKVPFKRSHCFLNVPWRCDDRHSRTVVSAFSKLLRVKCSPCTSSVKTQSRSFRSISVSPPSTFGSELPLHIVFGLTLPGGSPWHHGCVVSTRGWQSCDPSDVTLQFHYQRANVLWIPATEF